MAIEIEDAARECKPDQPGFLLGLAQRDSSEISLAVRVPTELQPALQLAMVGQQHASAIA